MTLHADIEKIMQQEDALRFDSMSEGSAWALGCQMREAAAAKGLGLVIDIRIGQRQLFFAALPGTSSDNSDWVRRKANAVLRFHKSSYRLNLENKRGGRGLDAVRGIDLMDFIDAGGSFPIHIKGTGIIGAVTVSGIPQRDDHGFVVEQLCAFLNVDHAALALGPEVA